MGTIALYLLLSFSLLAQVDTSVIGGTVRDDKALPIAGATLSIRNLETDFAVQLETNDHGIYISPPLHTGHYEITAEKSGLQKAVTQLLLQLGERPVADLTLRVPSVTESVTVTESVSEIASDSAVIGGRRNEQEVDQLPVNTRDVVRILELTPGTVPAGAQAQTLGFSSYRGQSTVSVNGQSDRYTGYVIDGIDNTENHAGASLVVNASLESIAEVRVMSAGMDAQFGRGAGVVDIVLKSGTKDFHGSLFYYNRNSALDAKNFFAPPGKAPRLSYQDYGGSFGGPITLGRLLNPERKKFFFFADFEGYRRATAENTISTLPLPAYVAGDFSQSPNRIYDPLTTETNPSGGAPTRQQFPGNIIPPSRIDAVGHNVASLYPTANRPGTANNYIYNPIQLYTFAFGDVKGDYYISSRDWLTLRYTGGNLNAFEPSALPLPAVGAGPSFPGNGVWPHLQTDVSYTHTFSSAMYNEFRIGASRMKWHVVNLTYGQNIAQQLGIPGVNIPGDPTTSGSVSVLSVTGYQPLGDNSATPSIMASDNYEASDNFSFVRGAHSFKVGFETQRRRYNLFQAAPRGTIAFSPTYTTNPASPAGTGDGLAEVLLGVPRTMSNQIINGTRGMRRPEYFSYLQDSWKATRRLTINVGLRYELYVNNPFTEEHNRIANFIPQLGNIFPVASAQLPSPSGTDTDYLNLAPRLGIAYAVNSNTTVRTSYGYFYYALRGCPVLAYNPPFTGNIAYTNDPFDFVDARRLSQGFDRPTMFSAINNNLAGVQENLQTPNVQQWNFSVQRELQRSLVLTVSYVGSKGTHAGYGRDINAPVPGPGALTPRRQWPQFATITWYGSDSNSNFNTLQAVLEKRLSRGLTMQTSYNWSHCTNDGDSLPLQGDGGVQNPLNRRGDRGNCEFDIRHRWVTTLTYQLPFGRNQRFLSKADRVTASLVGGWQLNSVLNLYSGFFFTPLEGVNTLNSTLSQRPDLVPGCNPNLPASERTPNRWFNTSCFTTPALYTFGNAGRNILIGPGTKQLDVSLFKDIPLAKEGRFRAQFRAESYNIANTPQLNNPNNTIGVSSAGTISNAGSPGSFARMQRQLQFALRLFF